jgi:hypothetical protein
MVVEELSRGQPPPLGRLLAKQILDRGRRVGLAVAVNEASEGQLGSNLAQAHVQAFTQTKLPDREAPQATRQVGLPASWKG